MTYSSGFFPYKYSHNVHTHRPASRNGIAVAVMPERNKEVVFFCGGGGVMSLVVSMSLKHCSVIKIELSLNIDDISLANFFFYLIHEKQLNVDLFIITMQEVTHVNHSQESASHTPLQTCYQKMNKNSTATIGKTRLESVERRSRVERQIGLFQIAILPFKAFKDFISLTDLTTVRHTT